MRFSTPVVVVLMFGALGAAGCSSASSTAGAATPQSPATAAGSQQATAAAPNIDVQMTPQGTRISGPQLELVRDAKGIRGHGPLGAVELSENKGSFRGIVGTGTTNLHVEPTSDGNFNMRGMFAGALGDLEVRDDRIQGQLGHCQFDLRAAPTAVGTGKAYNGQRWCGPASSTTTLTLSPQIDALDPVDRGALIAILLGR